MSERTAQRWVSESEVRAEVEAYRRGNLDQAVSRMSLRAVWATDQIAELAEKARSESVRLAALRSMLSTAQPPPRSRWEGPGMSPHALERFLLLRTLGGPATSLFDHSIAGGKKLGDRSSLCDSNSFGFGSGRRAIKLEQLGAKQFVALGSEEAQQVGLLGCGGNLFEPASELITRRLGRRLPIVDRGGGLDQRLRTLRKSASDSSGADSFARPGGTGGSYRSPSSPISFTLYQPRDWNEASQPRYNAR